MNEITRVWYKCGHTVAVRIDYPCAWCRGTGSRKRLGEFKVCDACRGEPRDPLFTVLVDNRMLVAKFYDEATACFFAHALCREFRGARRGQHRGRAGARDVAPPLGGARAALPGGGDVRALIRSSYERGNAPPGYLIARVVVAPGVFVSAELNPFTDFEFRRFYLHVGDEDAPDRETTIVGELSELESAFESAFEAIRKMHRAAYKLGEDWWVRT